MHEYPEYCDNCGSNHGELIYTEASGKPEWSCIYCYNALHRTDPIIQSVCHLMNLLESRITERLDRPTPVCQSVCKMRTDIIDGDLVDTYGGDYTFQYVYVEDDDGELVFYEYYLGAKEKEVERVYDEDDIAEYTAIYDRIKEDRRQLSWKSI